MGFSRGTWMGFSRGTWMGFSWGIWMGFSRGTWMGFSRGTWMGFSRGTWMEFIQKKSFKRIHCLLHSLPATIHAFRCLGKTPSRCLGKTPSRCLGKPLSRCPNLGLGKTQEPVTFQFCPEAKKVTPIPHPLSLESCHPFIWAFARCPGKSRDISHTLPYLTQWIFFKAAQIKCTQKQAMPNLCSRT